MRQRPSILMMVCFGLLMSSCGAFSPLIFVSVETVSIPPATLAAMTP
jgi:hypothetical protein